MFSATGAKGLLNMEKIIQVDLDESTESFFLQVYSFFSSFYLFFTRM
jgi:hypothetical protein